MSKYRILEKKGETKIIGYPASPEGCSGHYCCSCGETETQYYVPRFVVQQGRWNRSGPFFQDLKEFTSIKAAREYKHDLELEDGIERE